MIAVAAGLVVGGGVALGAVAARAMFSPRSALLGRVVFRGERANPPRIAFTFDDGPDPAATPRVLDVLGRLGVPGAFFVIGRCAERHPAVLRRIHAEGHLLGNHSFHHHHLGTMRRAGYWRAELTRTEDAIEAATGVRPRLFRPPMGFRNWHLTRAARERDDVIVTWTRRAYDGVSTSAEKIVARLASRMAAGDIIALHDGTEPNGRRDPDATIAALPELIDRCRSTGLQPVRLDDLIGEAGYRR